MEGNLGESDLGPDTHKTIPLFPLLGDILKILHSFNLTHNDIKPDNIAWSNAKDKLVLLDFGMATFNSEEVGYESFVSFKGTLKYAGEEMKKVYMLKSQGFVDLYYNDLHCAKQSVDEIEGANQKGGTAYTSPAWMAQIKASEREKQLIQYLKLRYYLYTYRYGRAL